MKTLGRAAAMFLLLLTIGLPSVSGQSSPQKNGEEYYSQMGRLNAWTTEPVYRQKYGAVPEFLKVRFGKHRGFDRVVFELDEDLVGYFITYGKPPFQGEASEETVKVRGRAFVEIALYPVTSTDENIEANEKILAEQNKLKMPLIREAKPVEWFEGELRYVIGLKKETPFRVQVLSHPARLVVDFKR